MQSKTFISLSILLFHLALFTMSCGSIMPKSTTKTLFRTDPSSEAQFAVSTFPANKKIQVVRDTSIEAQPITIPFFGRCTESIEPISASSIYPESQGQHYQSERTCDFIEGDYLAGFVLVLTQDVHKKGYVWVSCPALLFANDASERLTVAKEYITLSKKGNGEYIFVQK